MFNKPQLKALWVGIGLASFVLLFPPPDFKPFWMWARYPANYYQTRTFSLVGVIVLVTAGALVTFLGMKEEEK